MRKQSIIYMPKLFRLSIVKLETNGENGFPSVTLGPALCSSKEINDAKGSKSVCCVSIFLLFTLTLFGICQLSTLQDVETQTKPRKLPFRQVLKDKGVEVNYLNLSCGFNR